MQLTIEDMIAEGDKVAVRWTLTATHTSGVQVTMTGISIGRFAGGKFVEGWDYGDALGMRQRLGFKLVPPLTETTFARVTFTQMKPDTIEEAVKLYQDSVVPDAQSQNGYRGIYLLSDFKTGNGISIAIWDSEEDAIANEQSGYYQKQIDRFKDILTAQPVREGYVVTVQE